MDKHMKMIFDLYLEDEIYSDAIAHDQQYLTIIKEIKSLKKEMNRIVSTDQKTEFSILTQKLFDTYMNLSNLYRYYDFIEGFTLGTINGIHCINYDNRLTYEIEKVMKEYILEKRFLIPKTK